MDLNQAYSLTEELGSLKYFPSSAAAIAKVAEIVADLCRDEKQARKLVDAMCERFDEWPGPVSLRAVYRELFSFPEPSWKPDWEDDYIPALKCLVCEDVGFHRDPEGLYRRCNCDASRSVSEQMVDDFNKWRVNRRMPGAEIVIRRKEPIQ
jgi:hypothetical protein